MSEHSEDRCVNCMTQGKRSETAIPRHDESHGQSASDCTICEAMAIRVTAPEPIDVHNARKFLHAWGLQQHPDVTRMVPSLATMFHREREAGQHERGRPTATACEHPLNERMGLVTAGGLQLGGWCKECGALDLGHWHTPEGRRERATPPAQEATDREEK